jgi:hypothetical protein
LLVLVEKIVRPADRRSQRRMPLVGVASPLEQIEARPQPLEQGRGRQQLRACGGELEREWQPDESRAEATHRLALLDVGANGPCPLAEERDGLALLERGEIELDLALDAQRLSAGDEEPERGRGGGELGEWARSIGK